MRAREGTRPVRTLGGDVVVAAAARERESARAPERGRKRKRERVDDCLGLDDYTPQA